MTLRIGDKVRVSLPEGAQWNRKTASRTVTTDEINGAEGIITQALAFSGEAEFKVQIHGWGEFRFWGRDLQPVVAEPQVEDEGPTEQIQ